MTRRVPMLFARSLDSPVVPLLNPLLSMKILSELASVMLERLLARVPEVPTRMSGSLPAEKMYHKFPVRETLPDQKE